MEVHTGIDWSENRHDIVMMNEAGAAIVRQTFAHTPEGFLELEASYQSSVAKICGKVQVEAEAAPLSSGPDLDKPREMLF
jgi:hypothetical protein